MLNSLGFGNGKDKGADRESIIHASLEIFSSKGYMGTSLESIAKACNTTEKHVNSLFDKESLFREVIAQTLNLDGVTAYCSSVLEMFASIVDTIKRDVLYNPVKATLVEMLVHSAGIPAEVDQKIVMDISTTKFYKAVDNARLQGIIEGTDASSIIKNFIKSTYSIIEGYKLSGVPMPETEWFVATLLFSRASKKDSLEEIVKKQNSVIETFVADYQSILFVDLDTKEVEVFKTNGDDENAIKAAARKGYGELRRKFAESYLFPEDVDWFMQETDPENIIDKLMEDPVLYIEHRILINSKPYFYQTVISLDPGYNYGNKIIMGGHRIRKNHAPGVKKETEAQSPEGDAYALM